MIRRSTASNSPHLTVVYGIMRCILPVACEKRGRGEGEGKGEGQMHLCIRSALNRINGTATNFRYCLDGRRKECVGTGHIIQIHENTRKRTEVDLKRRHVEQTKRVAVTNKHAG